MTEPLQERLHGIQERILKACHLLGRDPKEVRLVAVSKKHAVPAIVEAMRAGVTDFGENYAQELSGKAEILRSNHPAPTWHFVGHLQRNKVPLVVGAAQWIHTIDRGSLVVSLAEHVQQKQTTPLSCLVQVNVGGEPQKHGCSEADLSVVLDAFESCNGAVLCKGLMCIPPASPDPDHTRSFFRRLRLLRDQHALQHRHHVDLQELSMGMSQDFEMAIEEGATMVRIGTALFGHRTLLS